MEGGPGGRLGLMVAAGLFLLAALGFMLSPRLEPGPWHGRPQVAATGDGTHWLLLREISPSPRHAPQYRLFNARPADDFVWRDAGVFAGAAMAMFAGAPPFPRETADGLWIVMEDGAAVFHEGARTRLLVASRPDLRFRGACPGEADSGPLALAGAESGALRLYRPTRTTEDGAAAGGPNRFASWEAEGEPLATEGRVQVAGLVATPRGPLAFWRAGAEGGADPLVNLARYEAGGWRRLPSLDLAAGAAEEDGAPPFAVLSDAGRLLAVADQRPPEGVGGPDDSPLDSRDRTLTVWRLKDDETGWEPYLGLLPPATGADGKRRLGLAVHAAGWLARADSFEVSAFALENTGEPDETTHGASASSASAAASPDASAAVTPFQRAEGGFAWKRLRALGRSAAEGEAGRDSGPALPAGVVARQPLGGFTVWVAATWIVLMAVMLVCSWRLLRWAERWTPSRRRPGALATPLDRGLAFMIDAAVVAPFPAVMLWVMAGDSRSAPELSLAGYWLWLGALSLYAAVAEGLWGATIGKRCLGLRVRSTLGGRGGRIMPWQAWSRNLLRVADFWPWTFGGVFFMPYLTALLWIVLVPGRRRMGDWVGQTLVRRHVPVAERRWILASASPRRLELLRERGLAPAAAATNLDESAILGLTPEKTALSRAERKLWAAVRRLDGDPASRTDEVVVAGDTVVILDGRVMDKPADREEQAEMLNRLSGRTHQVATGVAICDRATGQVMTALEITEVDFRPLPAGEIADYVAGGDGLDKAGGYGIQGPGKRLVAGWRGSYTNIVGMPMELFEKMLDELDG